MVQRDPDPAILLYLHKNAESWYKGELRTINVFLPIKQPPPFCSWGDAVHQWICCIFSRSRDISRRGVLGTVTSVVTLWKMVCFSCIRLLMWKQQEIMMSYWNKLNSSGTIMYIDPNPNPWHMFKGLRKGCHTNVGLEAFSAGRLFSLDGTLTQMLVASFREIKLVSIPL